MEFVPKFIQLIHEKYNVDSSKLDSLWKGIASEKLCSTYRIYWKEEYNKLKKDAKISVQEAMKIIASSWKKLSKMEKENIYHKYVSTMSTKYLPDDLSEEDAHDYFKSKDLSYLRKMVSSFYDGEDDINEWTKQKCISFLVEFNETV